MKKYVLMQIGCPECKTTTEVLGYFDNLTLAGHTLEAYNKELVMSGKKVEYKVFELPEINRVDEYYRNK